MKTTWKGNNNTSYYTGHIFRGTENGFARGTVCIEDGYLVEERSYCTDSTIDGIPNLKNVILSPLFFNAHTHLGDSFITQTTQGTLEEIVMPPDGLKHRALESASIETIARGIARELEYMAKSGTGFFCDYRENGVTGLKAMELALQIGNKHNTNKPTGLILSRPASNNQEGKRGDMKEISNLLLRSDGLGLNSLSDFSPLDIVSIEKITSQEKKLFSAHFSEGRREDITLPLGKRCWPLIHLASAKSEDMTLLAEKNIPVVICPRSNLLFTLMPDISKMVEKGLELMVGTDNAFLGRPDMFSELEIFYRILHYTTRKNDRKPLKNAAQITFKAGLGLPLLKYGSKYARERKGIEKRRFQWGLDAAENGFGKGKRALYQVINNWAEAENGEIEHFIVNRASALDVLFADNGD